jgi:hypothetical protein
VIFYGKYVSNLSTVLVEILILLTNEEFTGWWRKLNDGQIRNSFKRWSKRGTGEMRNWYKILIGMSKGKT